MRVNPEAYRYGKPVDQVAPPSQQWGPVQSDPASDQLYPGRMPSYTAPGYRAPPVLPQPQPPGVFGYENQTSILADPIVADAALQYGSKLMGTGRAMVDKELGKYIAFSSLKYYFAVDTRYVIGKLKLLFFPFFHSDWFLKFDGGDPLLPRYDVNAPDLYIPTMAYTTYVLVAGLMLGLQNRFAPEVLGILASQALAWNVAENLLHIVTIYIGNIKTRLRTLDIIAFTGYKYVGIILATLSSLIFGQKSYYLALVYFSITLTFYIVRALKFLVLADQDENNLNDDLGSSKKMLSMCCSKRKTYFILVLALSQPLLMWWLSFHLISPSI